MCRTGWKCFYMRDRIGEVFDGSVSAVTSFGMFVLLDDAYVEGLVHITDWAGLFPLRRIAFIEW